MSYQNGDIEISYGLLRCKCSSNSSNSEGDTEREEVTQHLAIVIQREQ